MKAALIFTGTGPILAVTDRSSLDDPVIRMRLEAKGIAKAVAHELPLDEVRRWYGVMFDKVVADADDDAFIVVDVDGAHIFCHLRLGDLGPAVLLEAVPDTAWT